MKILFWISVVVIGFVIYGIYSGTKREKSYQRIISDLTAQLTDNPFEFFYSRFHMHPKNYIIEYELTSLVMEKLILLTIERKVRSPVNISVIPSDISTLVDARKDFEKLCALAYSIANNRK